MNTLLEYITKGLVADPDAVKVSVTEAPDAEEPDLYEIEVGEGDVGKVIGRQGRTAHALRAVMRATAARTGRRARVEILD